MVKNDLRKLNRAELLELLLDQTKENEHLREELRIAEEKLADKKIVCEKAGSIAEAALQLNKVFESAQAACDQYIENVKSFNETDTLKITEEECNAMIEKAKAEADAYWDCVIKRVEELTSKSPTLKKLLEQDLINIKAYDSLD